MSDRRDTTPPHRDGPAPRHAADAPHAAALPHAVAAPHAAAPAPRRGALRRLWLGFFLAGSLAAGAGFAYKLHEFFWALSGTEGFEFAGVHLITYLLVALGFLLLLVHGVLRGHFGDIEQPKHDLLERERARDERDFA